MRDLLDPLLSSWHSGRDVALATVTSTWSSAPRQPGAAMLVGPDGTVVGSVSGGCVESALYELAIEIRDRGGSALQRYGVTDDDALAVGLTCGGAIEVFVERLNRASFPDLDHVVADIAGNRPVAVATIVDANASLRGRKLVVRPDSVLGTFGSDRLDAAVRDDARGLLTQGQSQVVRYGESGERRAEDIGVFVSSFAAPPRMIIFGATDFAATLVTVGALLGYRVTVCDARAIFATPERFPHADEVVQAWPHRYLGSTSTDDRTVVCVLTHDPKFEIPLLQLALRLPLAFVGAMGSRRTVRARLDQLAELGVSTDELARLHAPIGLDLGARTPEETAVSIAAEIIATRWGGSGTSLRNADGPIHHRPGQQR